MLKVLSILLSVAVLATGQTQELKSDGGVRQNFLFNWVINSGHGRPSMTGPGSPTPQPIPTCVFGLVTAACSCGTWICTAGQMCDAQNMSCLNLCSTAPTTERCICGEYSGITCNPGMTCFSSAASPSPPYCA